MGKAVSRYRRAKQHSASSHSASEHIVEITEIKRLKEKIKRREELIGNVESKYLTLQRETIQKYKPGSLGKAHSIDHPAFYNIGFFGMPAVGKSSLLNSIYFAIKGAFPTMQKVQVVPLGYKGEYPTKTQRLRVTKHICMIAYDGNELTDILTEKREAVLETIRGQLCGSSKRRPSILPDGAMKGHAQQSANGTHCAVVVIRPSKLDGTTEHYNLLIKEIHQFTGRYPVGLITNFDVSEQEKIENTRIFMQTNGIGDIFEVESTHINPLPIKDQIALLDMIEACMCLSDKLYEEQEESQRK